MDKPSVNGGFLKQGYPQIIHLNRISPYKPSIWGYPTYGKPQMAKKQLTSPSHKPKPRDRTKGGPLQAEPRTRGWSLHLCEGLDKKQTSVCIQYNVQHINIICIYIYTYMYYTIYIYIYMYIIVNKVLYVYIYIFIYIYTGIYIYTH